MRRMLRRVFLRSLFRFGSSAWIAACGAGQSATPANQSTTSAKASAPAQRPLPTDPLQLLVGAPNAVLDVRADRLRDSALFARTRPMFERVTCTSTADVDW